MEADNKLHAYSSCTHRRMCTRVSWHYLKGLSHTDPLFSLMLCLTEVCCHCGAWGTAAHLCRFGGSVRKTSARHNTVSCVKVTHTGGLEYLYS